MPYYAQIDADRRCTSVTETAGPISGDNLIELGSYDTSLLDRIHDAETGEWGALPPAPAPEWEWFIDIGPFFDRFGAAKMAVLTSTDPGVQAILNDTQIRKWIALNLPEVAQSVAYIGTKVPAVTAALQTAILTTPVQPAENLALRKVYFNA